MHESAEHAADGECSERIDVPVEVYERVRANPRWFVVRPHHAIPRSSYARGSCRSAIRIDPRARRGGDARVHGRREGQGAAAASTPTRRGGARRRTCVCRISSTSATAEPPRVSWRDARPAEASGAETVPKFDAETSAIVR
jgi:hypothetical protein